MIPKLSVAEIPFTKQAFFFFSGYIFDIWILYYYITLSETNPQYFYLISSLCIFFKMSSNSTIPLSILVPFISATFCREFSCVKFSTLLVASRLTRNKSSKSFPLDIQHIFFHTHQVLSSD